MSEARIRQVSGPVLRALVGGPFAVREAVRVGPDALLGEVVTLDRDEIVVQVFEDTTGLRPAMTVTGSGAPLSASLGPGLLGHMFDGLLRPLSSDGAAFVAVGSSRTRTANFAFRPLLQPGMSATAGMVLAEVQQPERATQKLLVPPDAEGDVVEIAAPGTYAEEAIVCSLRDRAGARRDLAMCHGWPVRIPRPISARLPQHKPLVTGQRVLDSLFPVAQGGRAAIPGGFGTGKTVLLESLAKSCDADVIVYLGCGERGNEIAGVLEEFPRLIDPRSGRALMERTVVIANTSNMPVAAREASIYTGVTVAEYFRDQGLHVALMADSTSRWAEALREVSGRLGELPGESGYPAYLSSRLADFYERAGMVQTLGCGVGSVTLIGAVSPPSGDFSEPVTSHTKRYVKSFWALDVKRAQARFYPAIHPLQSYAEQADRFAAWWAQQGNGQWSAARRQFLSLLDEQAKLERMARIIGKDALPQRQQLTLFCAELINEAFLRQSSLSPVDRSASPARQSAMMRIVARCIDLTQAAIGAGVPLDRIATLPVFRLVQRMGEEVGEGELGRFDQILAQLEAEFAALMARHEHGDATATAD